MTNDNAAAPGGAGRPYVVIGGGPAGLTAGYLLAKAGKQVIVLEATDQVGGIARTEKRPDRDADGNVRTGPDGEPLYYRFDLGGHRFFTKNEEVDALWHEIMGDEFLLRPRQSRIYWHRKFLEYPLQGMDVIRKLGPIDLTKALLSYLWAAVKPKGREDTLEEWVSNRFGKWLFRQFFKTYTEKVWGVSTSELSADWAAQRIKGLSFFSAAKSAFLGNRGNKIKSLISEFHYPRYGPGQLWEKMMRDIEALGGEVRLSSPATRLIFEDRRCVGVETPQGTLEPEGVISSLPLREMVGLASPELPIEIQKAAHGIRYRDFLTVGLVLDGGDLFPDNWIYIHEPGVRVGRIQNFRSWSPWMVPDPDKAEASIGLEYFCFEGDDLWTMRDEDLVELGKREIGQMGLGDPSKVTQGFAVRVPKAYPIYDDNYADRIETLRTWLDPLENYIQVGRNGLHRYNNSDHSMLTAMRAVDNLIAGGQHDIWAVNAESAYHEEDTEEKQPYRVPPKPPAMDGPLSESRSGERPLSRD